MPNTASSAQTREQVRQELKQPPLKVVLSILGGPDRIRTGDLLRDREAC